MHILQSAALLLLGIHTSHVLCYDESNDRKSNLRAKLFQSRTTTRKAVEEKEYQNGLDFFIMGWPKTGSTSMKDYLNSSDELKIVPYQEGDPQQTEFCFWRGGHSEMSHLFGRIEEYHLNSERDMKYGIKCPNSISGSGFGSHSIELLKKFNPKGTDTKLIIGLRHPVRWFESFYNYRAGPTESAGGKAPPSASLIGAHDWAGVNTDRARYEEGLVQLGNFPVQPEDEEWINGHHSMSFVEGGTPYKMFIYSMEQLKDDDKERHNQFLSELSSFMEVKKPFTVDNDVPVSNRDPHKNYDICDKEHDEVRKVLVENGKKTVKWIRANLPEADGVTLPNQEHFLKIVDTFGIDPCENTDIDLL